MKLYPNITIYFFIWIIGLLTIFTFGLTNFTQEGNVKNDLVKNLANWDGGHFLKIAQSGYTEKYQYAFFPFYPLTIRFVNQITDNYLISGLLISFASSFLALQFLYRLLSLDFNKELAEKTIIFLLIFPTSFFLITVYSEGLFLLLTILSFYFLRKEKLLFAALFAALAAVTRITGLAVAAALIIQVIQINGGINRKNRVVLLAPLGFIIYCIYLFNTTGDPFYFLAAEKEHWQRILTIPGLSLWESVKENNFIELAFAVFGLGMVLRSLRFLPKVYVAYGLFSLLFPLSTSSLVSLPRFILPIFPIFILLGMIKNPYVIFTTQLLLMLLLSGFSILFINGYWAS